MKNLWRVLFLMTWIGTFAYSSAVVPETAAAYTAPAYSEGASF